MPQTQFPTNVDLSSLNGISGFQIPGLSANDHSGATVSGAGDMNADGIADFAIGASNASPDGKSGAGIVYIIFGNANLGNNNSFDLQSLNGRNGFQIQGVTAGDSLGSSISPLWDVNNDHISDVIIGAPKASHEGGNCYVIFGHSAIGNSGFFNLMTLNGTNGFSISKTSWGSIGSSVSSAGDVNADGIEDLIIGDLYAEPDGKSAQGASYVIFGGAALGSSGFFDLATLNGANGFQIPGLLANDNSGWSNSGVGDINGDGVADFAISSPAESTGSNAGRSYVIFGKSTVGESGYFYLNTLNGNNGFQIPQLSIFNNNNLFSRLGDINEDGIADFGIGGSNLVESSYVILGHSNVGGNGQFDVTALNGTQGFRIDGVNRMAPYAGDINGDGIADLIMSIAESSNPAIAGFIIFGGLNTGENGLLNMNLDGIRGFKAYTASDTITSTNSIGDVNADGITDLIMGTPDASPNLQHSAGASYVLFGDILVNLTVNQLTIHEGETRVLGPDNIDVTYPFHPRKNVTLLYTVSDMQHGYFCWTNETFHNVVNFYDSELHAGQIQFVHDGSELAPQYTLSVQKLLGSADRPAIQSAQITFINQLPRFINNSLTLNQGETIVLNSEDLTAIDPDNNKDNPQILFTVNNVQYGKFTLNNDPLLQAITSFNQSALQNGDIQFVHDDTAHAPNYTVSLSEGGVTIGPQWPLIYFNYRPLLINNTLIMNFDERIVPLTSDNLSGTDDQTPAAELVFTVNDVQHGYFASKNNPQLPLTTFLQQNITGGDIQFVYDGSSIVPGYAVTLHDAQGLINKPSAANATIVFNEGPQLLNNSLFVNQGQTTLLNNNNLAAMDLQTPLGDLLFTVSDVQQGYFSSTDKPTHSLVSFRQQDVLEGTIQFVQNGISVAPSYNVMVEDNAGLVVGPHAAHITFNFAPLLTNNSLTVKQGQTTILTSNDLSATDDSTPLGDLMFTISQVQHGNFTSTLDGRSRNFFFQQDITTAYIQFVHDGSLMAPSYEVTVEDHNGTTNIPSTEDARITFDTKPVLQSNHLNINQGQAILLTSDNLSATDDQTPADELVFTVSNIQNGQFVSTRDSTDLPLTTFLQKNVTDGDIQFKHDGSVEAPGYAVRVYDAQGLANQPFAVNASITFNAMPVIQANELTISQGQTIIITSVQLSASDDHTAAEDLVFTANYIQHGHFEDINIPNTAITTFLQRQIPRAEIRFIQDASNKEPAYNISVTDNEGLSSKSSSAIVAFTPDTVNANNNNAGNLVHNALIGGAISGALGLGFFGLRMCLNYQAIRKLEQMGQGKRSAVMKDQADFHENVIGPIARKVFDQIKITGFLGYIGDDTMKKYLHAIELLVAELVKQEVDVNLKEMRQMHQNRLLHQIVRQTKAVLIQEQDCCSLATCSRFFKAAITPEQIEAHAEQIAVNVKMALKTRSADSAVRIDARDLELKVMDPQDDIKRPLLQ